MRKAVSKNTLLNLAGLGMPLLVALFAIPFSLRHLGDARFGILTIAWLIVGTSTLFDLGMGRATTKFVAEAVGRGETCRIPSILGCATLVQLILGCFGCALFISLSSFLVHSVLTIPLEFIEDTICVLIISGITIPISLVTSSYRGLLEGSHRFDLVNLIRFFSSSLNYLAPVVGIALGWGLVGIVGLMLCFRLVQLAATYKLCASLHPTISWIPKPDWDQFKLMFGFGGWVALSSIISPLQENIERLILASLLPIAMLAYYSVPKDMLDRIYILPNSLASALFPTFSTLSVTGTHELITLFQTATRIISMGIGYFVFLVVVLSDLLLNLWIGKEFAELAAPVLQILAVGALAGSLNLLAVSLFQGIGRPDITAKQQIIRLPIIAFASGILISQLGLVGAATAWSFGRTLALCMNFWAMSSLLGWSVREYFSRGSLIALLSTFTAIACYMGTTYIEDVAPLQAQVVSATTGAFVLGVLFWQYVVLDEERLWIHTALRTYIGRANQ